MATATALPPQQLQALRVGFTDLMEHQTDFSLGWVEDTLDDQFLDADTDVSWDFKRVSDTSFELTLVGWEAALDGGKEGRHLSLDDVADLIDQLPDMALSCLTISGETLGHLLLEELGIDGDDIDWFSHFRFFFDEQVGEHTFRFTAAIDL